MYKTHTHKETRGGCQTHIVENFPRTVFDPFLTPATPTSGAQYLLLTRAYMCV